MHMLQIYSSTSRLTPLVPLRRRNFAALRYPRPFAPSKRSPRLTPPTTKFPQTICSSSSPAADAGPPPDSNVQPATGPAEPTPLAQTDVQLATYHYVTFFFVMAGGLLFVAVLLFFTGDIAFQRAMSKVFKRLLKTVALPQLVSILSAMAFVKYGMEPVLKTARRLTKAQGPYEKSSEYYILREMYKPLEFLFLVAAVTTMAENFLPQVINIPKSIMQTVVRSTLSLTFVIAAARVVFNIKSRIVRESSWQLELKGDLTRQRRLEAMDKLLSLATLVVASIFGVKALGMDVNSVLAIGGVGGVAVGLAGREILENLFTGLIILTSNPFEVGDEVLFKPSSGQKVEGIVVDVGWYRTTIRSFEREIFIIPNSVFSRNVVLNITRKQREWRFYEFLSLRLDDLPRVAAVVSDCRKILRQDNRIIQKLHRRVFLDKVTTEHATVYISFYVEAANRDAFMAVKQDLLLAFIDCVERNGAQLARNKLQLEMLPSMPLPMGEAVAPQPVVDVTMLAQTVDIAAGTSSSPPPAAQPATTAAAPQQPAAAEKAAAGKEKEGKSGGNGSSNGGSSSGVGAAKAPQHKVAVAAGKGGGSSNVAAPSPTAQWVASALSSSPGAAERVVSAVSPDVVVGGTQNGSIVMGSFDDRQ